ncbi:adenosylcobinamide-phosphate synthase CbiB [Pararhodospirillum photometricum]|nr:adenosylcobinamide-phosphate synthase CbiB [Pararhodospirillum photometricum]
MFSLFATSGGLLSHAGIDPLFLLVLALGLDAYLGEMGPLFRLIPHPVVVMGEAIAVFDRRLNRPDRSEAARRGRGIFTVVVLVGACVALGIALQAVSVFVPLGWMLELGLVAVLLAQKSLHDHVAAVAHALETQGLAEGRRAVSLLVGRDPASLDDAGVARAAIESLAENFCDGVVAPVFWYVLFGLPGLLAFKMISTLDSMIGYRTATYRAFGWAGARLDDVANFLPARLSGPLLALGALGGRGVSARAGLRVMGRDHGRHRSPNAGWPEATMAGVLGLRLSGPRQYPGQPPREEPWIGEGRTTASARDIRRALVVYRRACLVQAGFVLVLALF